MAKYCITAARPKNASHHLNSEFKLWKWEKNKNGTFMWTPKSWKRTIEIAILLNDGNEVLTAEENNAKFSIGAAVEIELGIDKNRTDFKISDMPDK